jgi:hypothetical protein
VIGGGHGLAGFFPYEAHTLGTVCKLFIHFFSNLISFISMYFSDVEAMFRRHDSSVRFVRECLGKSFPDTII